MGISLADLKNMTEEEILKEIAKYKYVTELFAKQHSILEEQNKFL